MSEVLIAAGAADVALTAEGRNTVLLVAAISIAAEKDSTVLKFQPQPQYLKFRSG